MPDVDDIQEPNSQSISGVKEDKDLSKDAGRLTKAQVAAENQKWWFRGVALFVAVAIIGAGGYLEFLILDHLLDPCNERDDTLVFLAISPIASITLIVIFVLIGVFRGYRDKDMGRFLGSTIARNVGGEY